MVPAAVLAAYLGTPDATLIECHEDTIAGGTGATTARVTRIAARASCGGDEREVALIRKEFHPVISGRHAIASADPRHWAYWRREPLAYAAAVLPAGPALAAPRCYGVFDNAVYLQDVTGTAESPALAARRLGAWQATAVSPDVHWLAGHQLAQRVAVSDLDWTAVDADPLLASIWSRRWDLLAELNRVPGVLSHGDFHVGNLVAAGDTTVALDWGAVGVSPAGADLAHLALSTLEDLVGEYLAGVAGRFDPALVRLGYRTTLALTGVSRIHWMLSRETPIPAGYEEFVLAGS